VETGRHRGRQGEPQADPAGRAAASKKIISFSFVINQYLKILIRYGNLCTDNFDTWWVVNSYSHFCLLVGRHILKNWTIVKAIISLLAR
jgi:hypothetical protein